MPVTVTELTPTTGVEISGLSGSRLVDRGVAEDCLAALERCGVVVYREAHSDDEDLVAFSRLLGEVVPLPMGGHPVHQEIQRITRDPSKSPLAAYRESTFFWHIDGTTEQVPNKATLLTARRISDDGGGDTEFANTFAAYEALPGTERTELDGVRVVHSFAAAQLLVTPAPSPKERAAWDRNPARGPRHAGRAGSPEDRGPQEGHVPRGWLQRLPGRDRELPAEAPRGGAGRGDRSPGRADGAGGQGLRRAAPAGVGGGAHRLEP